MPSDNIRHIKVKFDMSTLNSVTQVACVALDCIHNTARRCAARDMGHCDYKHITIADGGRCACYETTPSEPMSYGDPS